MAGFIRRFGEFPSDDVLTAIEGVNIIDLPPPASISGVGTGFASLIGEFPDMTFAVEVDEVTGAITESIQPIEVFTSQDLSNKGGGFDPTLGQFGGDCGNAFVELRNKGFSRLAITPINMASASGIRLWRELPTNTSPTDPTPVVPVSGAQVAAGTEFRGGLDRIKTAQRIVFSDTEAFVEGIDGAVTTAAPAVTNPFASPGSTFITDGVQVGDIWVGGVIGAASPTGPNAFTLRVQAVTSETALVLEAMDGTAFAFVTDAALVFRIHPAAVADTGKQKVFGAQSGYLIPCRPLTDGQGTGDDAVDNTWGLGTLLTPALVPPALTATSADPLSGLSAATGPTTAVDFTAAVQKANAPNDAALDAKYASCYDALLTEEAPAREINLVWSARKSNGIRTKQRAHVLDASAIGIGRTTVVSPELDITKATALSIVSGDVAPGVGATRDERVDYSWPPTLTFIPEAVGTLIPTADGKFTDQGDLDLTYDGFLISILSNLAPERNPGESSATTRRAQSGALGIGRNVPKLDINSYTLLRRRGIAGYRVDRTVGNVIQSGVTSSLISGQKNINRRRMADFIEDSLAQRFVQLAKLPMSESLKDTILSEATEFLEELLSVDNPAAQRISGFNPVDGVSGNTPNLEAKGVFVIIVKVRTLATADFITVQAEIGEGVVITSTL
jgi:hypothetical protein